MRISNKNVTFKQFYTCKIKMNSFLLSSNSLMYFLIAWEKLMRHKFLLFQQKLHFESNFNVKSHKIWFWISHKLHISDDKRFCGSYLVLTENLPNNHQMKVWGNVVVHISHKNRLGQLQRSMIRTLCYNDSPKRAFSRVFYPIQRINLNWIRFSYLF